MQVCLATYTLVTPDPMSKAVVGAAVVAILVIDYGTDLIYDRIYEREQDAARQLLASIDRSERHHAVRSHLLLALDRPTP